MAKTPTTTDPIRAAAEKALRSIVLIRLAPARSVEVGMIQTGLLTTELALCEALSVNLKELRAELEAEVAKRGLST